MIQAKIIELVLKGIFKSDVFKDLIKYKDEPNEADLGLIRANEKIEELSLKLKAALDLFKANSQHFDKLEEAFKKIEKLSHPPAIPLKEINEFRAMKNEFKGVKNIINKLKKVPLLKSVFK